ncbi:ABC transporter substrate-binding protein [Gloeocapsopsis dulcis]|uniref:ABC transporter substrate-binding protein n=1 Tax=Gloeocapsopsis dulcis AAB1 = 1H9 TaxID=1433147 RepID=A0A6N8G2C9_9CHRO|nr:ABC transporter substrate-binding protein [Gloeocapsopsis dulcis]MUL39042.1 ABC transporter substrate-binding protein [Gloeocapsopsis dulcis AAB1 = 1H9]WNN90724.1 ABC transporter substrate-binding protein [Gloeocapsopsis dulcis]
MIHQTKHWFQWVSQVVVILILLIGCGLSISGCEVIPNNQANNATKITFWHGVNPPSNRDVLQKLVDQFNREHPDIQVESLYVGQAEQQLPKILAAVVGNAPPDLLWFNATLTGQLVELDAIRPIEDWLTALPVKNQLDPALWESMEYQGHIWSVPFGTNNSGVFYRPSLFQAAGITKLPETWEELRQVARQLTRDTDGDKRIDQHGIFLPLGKGEFAVFLWLPFMWSAGGELVADTQQAAAVDLANNQGAIAALQFWQDLIADGSAVLSLPERGFETDDFLAGKVAMQLTGPWTLGQLKSTGVDFGVFPIPVDKRPATGIGGENLFVFKSTPQREQAALQFTEFVLSEQFQTQWAIGTGYLPVNLKARESSQYKAFAAEQPAVQVFLDQAQYGRSRPIFPGYSRVSENIGRALEAVLLRKSSPTEALQAAQQRLNLIFQ